MAPSVYIHCTEGFPPTKKLKNTFKLIPMNIFYTKMKYNLNCCTKEKTLTKQLLLITMITTFFKSEGKELHFN